MINPGLKKIRMLAVAGLVALSAASMPAGASHGHDYIVPLAAFVVIGALAHQHHHNHYYHPRSQYRPHYRPYRRHSHSYGGYGAPRHKHHRNW